MLERLGRYELIQKIGSGGMAEVFLARLRGVEGFSRQLVVKRMRPELSKNREAVRMFLDEARLSAKLHHPQVVQVFDLGEADGAYFIAMEYVDGPHLGKLARSGWKAGEPMPLTLCAYVVGRAAEGLHFAHEQRDPESGQPLHLVHRDISPHNILISRYGDVKVADFGVAKSLGQTSQTRSGVVKGKVAYLSPEQVRGEELDRRSDIFSLGIVLFEIASGRRLFKSKTDLVTLQRIAQEDAPAPSSVNPDIDPELDAICAKALARDRELRYQTMRELERDLDTWISTRFTQHLKTELARWVSRHDPRTDTQVELPPYDARTTRLERTEASPDLHLMETRIEALPAEEDWVEPHAVVEEQAPPAKKDESASGFSLDTMAFGQLKTNLSTHGSRFIGRVDDLKALHALFEDGGQIVTLHGSGGTGKTRLAMRYAERHLPRLSAEGGGAWFCDLTDAKGIEGICSVVGGVLGVPLTSGRTTQDTVDLLAHAMATRGRTLVILDNFEQVVELGPQTLGKWAASAPEVRFLVTSREILRLPGEVCYELSPMGIPEPGAPAESSEAVLLFVERAQAVRPGYLLTTQDAPVVAEIVRKLDGIPLAIELAAARMSVLKPRQLLERLSRRFDVLRGGSRDASPRQATLRSTVDWSWNLLSPVEQDALAQCSVFRGGFSLDAAEEVIELSAHDDAPWTLDVVQALREKSLLRAYDPPELADETRFGMYESVREYAAEKLDRSSKRAATEARHAAFYLHAASSWAEGANGHEGAEHLARLEVELMNIQAVHARATSTPRPSWVTGDAALRAAVALEPLFDARGPRQEQIQLLGAALEAAGDDGDPVLRARAFAGRGRARRRLGLIGESRTDFAQALRLAREAGDRLEESRVLRDLGILASDEGRLDDAERNYEDALALQRQLGDRGDEAMTLAYLAFLHDETGRVESARAFYEACLERLSEVGDRQLEAVVLGNYAGFEQERGNLDKARAHYEEAIALLEKTGRRTFIGPFLGSLATLCHERGELDEALRRFERALESMRETGNLRYEGLMLGYLGAVYADLGRLDEARATLDQADRRHAEIGDPRHLECARLHRAFLDVAEARRAEARGDRSTAERLRASVRSRVDEASRPGPPSEQHPEGGPSPAEMSDDVRRALRLLGRALGA